MPLVSLLDLEKSIKLNQLLNQVNSATGANTNIDTFIYQINQNHANLLNIKNNINLQALANLTATNAALQAGYPNATIQIPTGMIMMTTNSVNNAINKQINYSRYKTELCRQFSENGECKYGDKCQFAHGMNDLKDVNRHPKYKTDFCKTFHSKGFCPYGPRCHFIHDLNENFELLNTPQSMSPSSNQPIKPVVLDNLAQSKQSHIQIDRELEAIQTELASKLFSSITDDIDEDIDQNNRLKEKFLSIKIGTSEGSSGLDSSSSSENNCGSNSSTSSSTSPLSGNLINNDLKMDDQKAKVLFDSAISNMSIQSKAEPKENNDVFSNLILATNLLTPDSCGIPTPPASRTRSSTSSTSSMYSTSSTSSFYNSDNEISCERVINHSTSPIKQQQFQQQQLKDKYSYLGPIGRPNFNKNDLLVLSSAASLQQQQQQQQHQQQTLIQSDKNLFLQHQIIW